MKSLSSFVSIVLLSIGVALAFFSLLNILFQGDNDLHYLILLILSCLLMIASAFLVTRSELISIRKKINETESVVLKAKNESSRPEDIKNWRLRDLDYRVKKLEEKIIG
ncbi:MAG TPA: hypothetical protein EYP86_01815 [Candidatus Altiarchaeales archaeon]|nr:hypothetical protein [Candidatus Altiarchaeales archaeon]